MRYLLTALVVLPLACTANAQPCPRIVRDIGQPGAGGPVMAFILHDDGSGEALFVGGELNGQIGGISADGVGKFDGERWSSLGFGFNSWVGTLARAK